MIFVFGSNEGGHHGKGAARTALVHYGAKMRVGFGHQGTSFAIPTKDWQIRDLDLEAIRHYIWRFLAYARTRPESQFKITQLGCGLAGHHAADIAPMFKDAPMNCYFDEAWEPYLGANHKYWGTFP